MMRMIFLGIKIVMGLETTAHTYIVNGYISHNSRYDLPFIRTRAVICGLDFPEYGVYVQTDNWMTLKNKFKLSRNSLENSSLKLLGSTNKSHLTLEAKHGMLRGERWARDFIMDHNKCDVVDTERVYEAIHKFVRPTRTSI